MKIAVISHTEHYLAESKKIVAWGSTVKELDKIAEICDQVFHIAPFLSKTTSKGAISYNSDKLVYVPLKPSGGKTWLKKMSIFYNLPYNLYKIHKTIKKVDYIQFRAPTSIGLYVLPYLFLFVKKSYWVKYAGNWVSTEAPLANRIQIWWLRFIERNKTKITLNGSWPNSKKNMLAFENPCLDNFDRDLGLETIQHKNFKDKISFCFVGTLHKFKGVDLMIEAFADMHHSKIGDIHIVGDGEMSELLKQKTNNYPHKVIFHGFLPKDQIKAIYQKCHVIILPSQSEGFPKVIAEGMNYGCIPLVSDVSCVSQYIQNGKNGYLINPITTSILKQKIAVFLNLENDMIVNMMHDNYQLAEKFTYTYYIDRLKNEILR